MSDAQTSTDTSLGGETCSAYNLTGVQYSIGNAVLPDWWLGEHMPKSDEVDLQQLGRPTVRRSEQIAEVDLSVLPDELVFKGGKHYPRERVIAVYNEWAKSIAQNAGAIPAQEGSGGDEQTAEAGEVDVSEVVPVEAESGPMGGWFYTLLTVLTVPYLWLFGVTLQAMHFLCATVYTVKDLDLAIVCGSSLLSIGVAYLTSGVDLDHMRREDLRRPRLVVNLLVYMFGTLVGLCLLSAICG